MNTARHQVTTTCGPVHGERRADGSLRFLGIPYARPPVGERRFAAPTPPDPWTEPLDAVQYGPTAQRRAVMDTTTIPEPSVPGDGVLNLNVFTPHTDPGGLLPVLVWIHGGGYVAGSAASLWYDGSAFNRDGVVLVSLGYRIGIEGFLHLDDAPDNRGVLDWIAALEWVRDNVAAFGGDPEKVTIAGQSAGGGAVQTLLAVPAACGLFRGVISASGVLMNPDGPEVARAASRLFTARTGIPAMAAALSGLGTDQLLDLQDRLLAPGPDRAGLPPMGIFAPFADGELIPAPVRTSLTEGDAGADTPLLLGSTAHEFNVLPEQTETPPLPELLGFLGADPGRAETFRAAYEHLGRTVISARPSPTPPSERRRWPSPMPVLRVNVPPGSMSSRGPHPRTGRPTTASTCRSSSISSMPRAWRKRPGPRHLRCWQTQCTGRGWLSYGIWIQERSGRDTRRTIGRR
jgi:para-nitrobenzyl esterase